MSIADRFWAKVEKTDTCWLWKGGVVNGYGQFWLRGKHIKAHRYAYESLVGPIAAGLQIDHLCRVRNCVNPAHMEPVIPQENTRRGETGANNAQKTHCPQGHIYDVANTYYEPDGRRHCRACRIANTRTYRVRLRAKQATS